MVWLDPMPVPEDLSYAYEEYYTHGEMSSRSLLFRTGKYAYRIVVDAFLSIAGIPAERRRAKEMTLGDHKPGSLLDIGCGQGTFLGAMAARGWTVSGVDFDSAAVEAARSLYGVDVSVGTVDSVVDTGATFDVVTASHVLEHVPDPVDFLRQCRRLLRPGGCVVLRTPNVDSLGHKTYGRFWRGLEPPRHLHLFTVAGLAACAKAAGFEGADCVTSSAAAEGMLMASYILAKKGEFRPSRLTKKEQLESKLLAPLFALRAKFAWLANPNSGEEICAVLTNAPATTNK